MPFYWNLFIFGSWMGQGIDQEVDINFLGEFYFTILAKRQLQKISIDFSSNTLKMNHARNFS
jgi:hypothetical protein